MRGLTIAFVAGACSAWLVHQVFRTYGDHSVDGRQLAPERQTGNELAEEPETAGEPAAHDEAFHETFDRAQGVYFRDEYEDELRDLAERWSRVSPPEAFAAFVQVRDRALRRELLALITTAWAAADPRAALAAAGGIQDRSLSRQLTETALVKLAERDPAGALDRLEVLPGRATSGAYESTLTQWALRDLKVATERLTHLAQPRLRQQAARAMALALTGRDGAKALDWAASLGDPRVRAEAVAGVMEVLREDDPAAAGEALRFMPDGPRKDEALDALAQLWVGRDPMAAVTWARQFAEGPDRDRAMGTLAAALATSDRETAIALLKELPASEIRFEWLAKTAGALGISDSEFAASWVDSLSYFERGVALEGIMRAWVDVDPHKLDDFVSELPRPLQQVTVLKTSEAWSAFEPANAVAWADRAYTPRGVDVGRNAFLNWAREDPDAAADYVAGLEDPALQAARTRILLSVLGKWQPATGAAWVETALTDSEVRVQAFAALASSWLNQDSEAASQWIAGMEPGPQRDAAVDSLLQKVHQMDPESAAAWTETLSQEQLRQAWMEKLQETP